MQLFHYHLVTSRVREVEARYIGKLGFDLVARHGRIGEELTSYEPGVAWNELDAMGFKLRLTELEKGAVNVVVQPGQWPTPRVDHLGFVLDEDEFDTALLRAEQHDLRVQEHGGRRTFVSTNVGCSITPSREPWVPTSTGSASLLNQTGCGWPPSDRVIDQASPARLIRSTAAVQNRSLGRCFITSSSAARTRLGRS